jgi:hypothetical protein
MKIVGKHFARTATVTGSGLPAVDGELPVVAIESVDLKAFNYDSRRSPLTSAWDANFDPAAPKWIKQAEMVIQSTAVVLGYHKLNKDGGIESDGYWGVAHIANAKFEDGVLTFDITCAIRLRKV